MGLPLHVHRLTRVLRDARQALSAFGREVLDEHRVSRGRQMRAMIGLFLRWGLDPVEYYAYHLYRPERSHLAPLYLSDPTNGEVLVAAMSARNPQRTKPEFHQRCVAAGLPTIPILAECSVTGTAPVLHDPDSPAWGGDLFTKPASSGEGRGARMWIRREGGGWSDGDAVAGNRDELLAILAASEDHADWIVQPRLLTHPDFADLTTGALSTARLVTYRDPTSGSVEILFAAVKLPCGGVGDNIALGGVAAPVDLDTGRLRAARPRDVPGRRTPFLDQHPVTGARVTDRLVPDWPAFASLARKVHGEVFPENATGGWDIAITGSGPTLVEANDIWGGCPLVQVADDRPIGLTTYPGVMLKYLKAAQARRALERRF